jgi:hypothetical protein
MEEKTSKNRFKEFMKYECKKCNYICSRKGDFKKHIETKKHNLEKYNKIQQKTLNLSCECGKIYKHRASLYNHKKICKSIYGNENIQEKPQNQCVEKPIDKGESNMVITKEMFMAVLEKNNELIQTINEIAPKIGNTTNHTTNNKFNLNVFLNEQCKDAMNLTDFIESLSICVNDLDYTKTNGYVKGVSNVFIKGLENLDTYARPVHCSDIKRKTMYIKEDEQWDKDKDNEKIKEAIQKVSSKHLDSLKEWESKNKNWRSSKEKSQEYMNYVYAITSNNNNNENKILTDVAQNVFIDKNK